MSGTPGRGARFARSRVVSRPTRAPRSAPTALASRPRLWLGFSPDAGALATLATNPAGDVLQVWDIATRRSRFAIPLQSLSQTTDYCFQAAFSPDGRRIACIAKTSGSPPVVKVWDTAGRQLLSLPRRSTAPSGSGPSTESVVWSARGDRLVYVTNPRDVTIPSYLPRSQEKAAGGLTVWNLDGKELFNLDEEGIAFLNPAFSPDGTRVAAVRRRRGAGGGRGGPDQSDAKVWDIATGRALFTIPDCTLMTFDPDGKRLAGVASSSERPARVHLWDAITGEERARLETPTGFSGALSITFSPAGRQVAATISRRDELESLGFHSELVVWDAASGKVRELGDAYTGVVFSPDGARIAASLRNNQSQGPGKPEVGVWDAVTGRQVLFLKGPTSYVYAIPTLHGIAFSPEGNRILSAVERNPRGFGSLEESEAKVWEATPRTGKP